MSSNGDLGDSSYCNAPLQLPLAHEPGWEYTYTSAEISPRTPFSLVHFDGIVAGTAATSIVFLLDTQSGREILKKNAYIPQASDATQQESFYTLMFSPVGTLAAVDQLGRYNIWAWPRHGLRRIGVSEVDTASNLGGFVLTDDHLIGMNKRLLAAMPVTNPSEPTWTDQLIHPAWGVVAARDGTVVAWTLRGTIVAVNKEGSELWRSQEAALLNRIVLDPSQPVAYVAPQSDEIVCRNIHDGSELWRYDYSQLLPAPRRAELRAALLGTIKDEDYGRAVMDELRLIPVAMCVTPRGLVLTFQSGDCLLLDRRGQQAWHTRLGSMADGGVAFQNAVLVHQSYQPLGISRLSRENLEYQPFRLSIPNWSEIQNREKLAELNALDFMQPAGPSGLQPGSSHQQPVQVVYGRFTALDLTTGKVLDEIKEGQAVAGGPMLPAKDKFIVALEREDNLFYPNAGNNPPCRIVGYNWLGPRER